MFKTASPWLYTLALLAAPLGPAAARGAQAEAAQGQADRAGPITRLTRASALREARVVGQGGERVAGVSDLVMDRQGRPAYVILNVGGVAGVGGDELVVPFRLVQFKPAEDNNAMVATVALAQERLRQAPRLEGNYRQLQDREWLRRNDEFYLPDERRPEAAAGREAGGLIRVGRLLDANARGRGDEEVADIEDVVVDQDYRARYLLLGAGGFLGIGQDRIAVPFERATITYDADQDRYTVALGVTKQQLEQAPRLGEDGFSSLGDEGFRRRIHQYFDDLAARP